MSTHTVITIDGPAASGKSSVARMLAERLGFVYVNTGAMYRAVTWWVLENGVDPGDENAVMALLDSTEIDWEITGTESSICIAGQDPTPHLREERVNRNVSLVSGLPAVRAELTEKQRDYADRFNVVMEGRDMGTVVFPESPLKFYIDASPEVRAQRRALQGEQDAVTERDQKDASRAAAPLKIADDANVIDSSNLTIEGVVGEVIGRIKEHHESFAEDL